MNAPTGDLPERPGASRSGLALRRPAAGVLDPAMRAYEQAIAARRRVLLLGGLALAVLVAFSWSGAEIRPLVFWNHLDDFTSYFDHLSRLDTGRRVWTDPAYWFWGIGRWARLLADTVLIAYVGTLTGAVLAVLGGVLASRNLGRPAWLRFAVRRALEFGRTVPDIVFALLFVAAFGLGALPGVMAIALHTTGTLGKLFAEVIENIDMKPVEGIASTGGNWGAQVRFGVLPQVLSNFVSYALLRFEINVRGATVIGFVGAGGIGMDLLTAIRDFYYADVSAMLLMLLACVMLIDLGSERVRHRLLALEQRR